MSDRNALSKLPQIAEREESGLAMSNFGLEIDAGLDAALRAGKRGHHYGWNFCGDIWFAGGKFHEAVNRYHVHVRTFSADTLEDLMNEVNSVFGSD